MKAPKEIWLEIKNGLVYSNIHCFICNELMYYGKNFLISTSHKTQFSCKCHSKISVEKRKSESDQGSHEQVCAECGKPVEIASLKEHAIRFRCTCGHNDICLVKDIDNTNKL